MDIQYRYDGTAKLTSPAGRVRHILSGREYTEVICDQADIPRYTDGSPAHTITSPPHGVHQA